MFRLGRALSILPNSVERIVGLSNRYLVKIQTVRKGQSPACHYLSDKKEREAVPQGLITI